MKTMQRVQTVEMPKVQYFVKWKGSRKAHQAVYVGVAIQMPPAASGEALKKSRQGLIDRLFDMGFDALERGVARIVETVFR